MTLAMFYIRAPIALTGKCCRCFFRNILKMPTVGTGSCPLWINYYKWSHQAFHMDRMVSDARAALAAQQKRADLKPPGAPGPSITSLPPPAASSVASLPPNLVSTLARVSHLPLLLIEVPGWMFYWSLLFYKLHSRESVYSMSLALQKSAISNSS